MALLPAVTPALTAPGQGCFFAAARIGPQAAPAFGGGTQPFGLRRRLRRRACGPHQTLPPANPALPPSQKTPPGHPTEGSIHSILFYSTEMRK